MDTAPDVASTLMTMGLGIAAGAETHPRAHIPAPSGGPVRSGSVRSAIAFLEDSGPDREDVIDRAPDQLPADYTTRTN
jgi:hypothetical protein